MDGTLVVVAVDGNWVEAVDTAVVAADGSWAVEAADLEVVDGKLVEAVDMEVDTAAAAEVRHFLFRIFFSFDIL